MPRINPRVHPLAAFDVLFLWGESFQFGSQLLQYGLREAVRQMKGDVLDDRGTFKVGEIAAAVPPGSAILLNGDFCSFDYANREIGVPGVVL